MFYSARSKNRSVVKRSNFLYFYLELSAPGSAPETASHSGLSVDRPWSGPRFTPSTMRFIKDITMNQSLGITGWNDKTSESVSSTFGLGRERHRPEIQKLRFLGGGEQFLVPTCFETFFCSKGTREGPRPRPPPTPAAPFIVRNTTTVLPAQFENVFPIISFELCRFLVFASFLLCGDRRVSEFSHTTEKASFSMGTQPWYKMKLLHQ